MSEALTVQRDKGEILEKVLITGDLSKLNPEERVVYYNKVCDSLGLNPYTKPFDYINLNGKLTLYCKRDATEQLRNIHGISITISSREKLDDLYIVTAKAQNKEGRTDESIGVVTITGLKGDNLANAIMKAETKAKRRVTLSLAGLGWTDETEIETIPNAVIEPEQPKPEIIIERNIRAEIGNMIKDMAIDILKKENKPDSELVVECKSLLKTFTSFTDEDGNTVAGKDDLKALTEKQLQPTYGKVKKEWEAMGFGGNNDA